ncbi:MAG TPA: hypothetical protein VFC00_39760 [Micromonosporaceae bacterium]|nr:hypothetical protein [Micromonosporaceae bacterium]
MRRIVARATAVAVLATAGIVSTVQSASAAVLADQNQYAVWFTNNDGTWTIWKNCYEYWDGSRTVAIGPGYIGRLVRNNQWIVNDEREKNPPGEGMPSINHPSYGGLGQFGWHHARGYNDQLDTNNGNRVWNITGRTCAASNGGLGVSHTQILQGPYTSGGVGYFDIDVFFVDQTRSAGNPLLRVRYRWRFFDSVVKMWAQVSIYCPGGCPDPNQGYALVKEPKFVANVARTPGHDFPGYTRTAVFNRTSTNPCTIFMGSSPTKATGQTPSLACAERARFRFDFGDGSSGGNGLCSTTNPCLNVVATAYDIDDGAFSQSRQHYLWEGWTFGLDEWAMRSADRLKGNDVGCNTSQGYAFVTDQLAVRRWELIGGSKTNGLYNSAMGLFPGWEGCTGAYSAGALYRYMEQEYWGVHMQFSVNDGWSYPSMP